MKLHTSLCNQCLQCCQSTNWRPRGIQVCRTRTWPLLNRPSESGMMGAILKLLEQTSPDKWKQGQTTLILITPLEDKRIHNPDPELGWDQHDWEHSILANGFIVSTSVKQSHAIFAISFNVFPSLNIHNIFSNTPTTAWSASMLGRKFKLSVFLKENVLFDKNTED